MQTLSDRLLTVAVTGAVQDSDPHVIADAQAEIERLGKEVLGLQIALDNCVDGGTHDMLRDGEIYARISHQTPCENFIPSADPERCLVCRFKPSSH